MTGPRPQGHYQVSTVYGGLIFTAGLTPRDAAGRLVATGRVGGCLDPDAAEAAARQAARNAAAVVADAAGGRENLDRLLRVTVYIACADGFTGHSALADIVSAVLETQLGLTTRPVRSAIGVRSLPGDAPIEIELTAACLGDREAHGS